MTSVLQFRRGNTAQNNSFTGAVAEISIDTSTNTLRVHNAITPGGTSIMPTLRLTNAERLTTTAQSGQFIFVTDYATAGVAPTWVGDGSTAGGLVAAGGVVSAASTASNLSAGTAGQIPFQSAPGVTSFFGPGSYGQFLMSNGAAAPGYQSTLTQVNGNIIVSGTTNATSTSTGALQVRGGIGVAGDVYVGGKIVSQQLEIQLTTVTTTLIQTDDIIKTSNTTAAHNATSGALQIAGGIGVGGSIFVTGNVTATTFIGNLTGTASTATSAATAYSTIGSLTAGAGLTGSTFNGSANLTWTLNTATLMQTSVNLASGAAGSIPYQTAANATGFLAIGTNGFILTSNGSAPVWTALSGLSAGLATTATNIAGGLADQIPYQTGPGATTFNAGLRFNGTTLTATNIVVSSTTNSLANTSTQGALLVTGGAAIARDLFVGGDINLQGNLYLKGAGLDQITGSTGTFDYVSLEGTGTSLIVFDGATIGGITTITNTTAVSSTNTGALQVRGGVGIAGGVVAGGTVTATLFSGNSAGGVGGAIHYQSATDVTAYLSTATTGNFLQANFNGAPTWTTTANIYVANAAVSTNLRSGVAGQLAYQTGASTTGFINTATTGNFLQANFNGAPTWTTTASIYVNRATLADTATTATSAATAYSTIGIHTAGTGLTGTTFNGSANVTWTLNTATLMQTSVNLASGLGGQIAYQTAANATGFITTATTGNFLQANFNGAPSWTTTASMYVNSAVFAEDLYGGVGGSLPYQSAANTTVFLPIGTNGFVLTSTGTAPAWTALSGLTAGNATTASNIANGVAGQVPYQISVGNTGFINTATTGNFLQANFNGAPTWTGTGSIYVNRATLADAATTATSAGTAYALAFSHTAGTGLTGTTYNGSAAVTWTLNTATLMQTSVNLASGASGQLAYQTAANATGFINTATTGNFLQANFSGAPTWTTTASMYVQDAVVSTNLRGGAAGQLHYQTGVNTSGYINTATTGNFLQANFSGAPTWTTTASIYVNRATVSDATQAAVTFNNSNTGDASGTSFNGSTARTVSANTLGALSLSAGGTVSGAVTFSGPVTFNGTATYVLSTQTFYTDNILNLHVPTGGVDSQWTVDDGKDVGFRFHYYTNSTDTNAALVLANDSKFLEFYASGAEGTSTFAGSYYGVFKTGNVIAGRGLRVGSLASSTATVVGEKLYVAGGIYSTDIVTATTFVGALTGTATRASNIVGGSAGSLPYQSAADTTTFLGIGTNGFVLTSNGTAPVWSALSGLSAGNATTATNLAGGTTGQIPYQTAAGSTSFAGPGTAGQFLQSNGAGAPSYVSTGSIYVGNAARVDTVLQTVSAVYYPTFVDSNNAAAASELVYTTSTFAINPATRQVSIGTATASTSSILTVNGRIESLTDPASEGGQLVLRGKSFYRWSIDNYQDGFRIIREDDATEANGLTALGITTSSNPAILIGAVTPYSGERLAVNGGGYFNGIVTATTFIGNVTGTASTATAAATAYSTIGTHTAGTGLSGTTFNGSANVTWTLNTATLMQTSVNLASGLGGQIAYQTAANATGFITTATTGNFLQANFNGAPSWTTTANIYVQNAVLSTNIRGGTAGQVPYQTGAGTTAFYGPGTAGQLLVSGGTGAPTYTNTGSIYVNSAVFAEDLYGGVGGSLPYQSAANTTVFLGIGTNGFVLTSNGTAPVWSALSGLSAGTATTATNIAGGTAGQVPYQTAAGATAFYGPGTAGQILVSAGTGAPTYTNTASIYVNRATLADTATAATTATSAGTAYATIAAHTAGTGLSGTTFNGSTAVTWTLNTATLMQTSVNLAGGVGGQLAYQTAANATGFVSTATTGNFLQANFNGAPSWTTTGSMYVARAVLADSVTGSAGSLVNALTIGTGLTGSPSSTYNGSAAVTVSLNTATLMATAVTALSANRVANAHTAGAGLSGTSFDGSAAVTWTLNTATLMQTSVNLAGGAGGSIHYQSAANTTAMLGIGTNGQVLTSNGSIPVWAAASGITAGAASQVQTIAQPVAGTYYPTFVDSNNASATAETVYTTSSFAINPSSGVVSITNTTSAVNTAGSHLTLAQPGTTGQSVIGFTFNNAPRASIRADSTNMVFNTQGGDYYFNNDFGSTSIVFRAVGTTFITGSASGSQIPSLGVGTAPSGTAGEIRATNEITAYYSDRRLKENVKVIDNAVTKVLSLNGITYTPNDLAESFGYDKTVKLVGLFADEVEAVLPEATRPAPFDLDETGNSKSGENYKTIQYEKLVPLLIEAIKEQERTIQSLKEDLADIKKQLGK